MKHKTFEEWIFENEPLEPGEQKALYDHLRDCDACYLLEKNWRQVEQLIETAPVAGPVSGFSKRWQVRLDDERRRHARRQSLAMLAATGSGAGIFLFLFGWQFVQEITAALLPIVGWAGRLGDLLATGQAAAATLTHVAVRLPPELAIPLSPLLVMGFFAALGAGAIAWLMMFRALARVPGLNRWAS